ncbi:MAG TPA: hypothetical protein VFI77_09595 [Gemmatimonadales bacterium]|nr:hypothetical protein [Gemmatimonadales bacterium]
MAVELARHLLGRPPAIRPAQQEHQHLELLQRLDVLIEKLMDVGGKAVHGLPALRPAAGRP